MNHARMFKKSILDGVLSCITDPKKFQSLNKNGAQS